MVFLYEGGCWEARAVRARSHPVEEVALVPRHPGACRRSQTRCRPGGNGSANQLDEPSRSMVAYPLDSDGRGHPWDPRLARSGREPGWWSRCCWDCRRRRSPGSEGRLRVGARHSFRQDLRLRVERGARVAWGRRRPTAQGCARSTRRPDRPWRGPVGARGPDQHPGVHRPSGATARETPSRDPEHHRLDLWRYELPGHHGRGARRQLPPVLLCRNRSSHRLRDQGRARHQVRHRGRLRPNNEFPCDGGPSTDPSDPSPDDTSSASDEAQPPSRS